MDLESLSLHDGSGYFDEILQMPRRSQELFFALLYHDMFEDSKQGMDIIDTILNGGNLLYADCKSPIEQIFNFAYDIVICNEGFPINELLYLFPQTEIVANGNRYIADFLLDTDRIGGIYREHSLKLVIECDGHEFHEKTKAQVEKNNKRNFDLQLEGYEVLHFSGSQIYKDPLKCAMDAYKYIRSKVGEIDIDIYGERANGNL